MGFVMNLEEFERVINRLSEEYRLYAPVLKKGEGRTFQEDIVRYDFIEHADELELNQRSDYSFKEILLPLSETLFYFTEDKTETAGTDDSRILVFLRACDLHALRRLDDIYLRNGSQKDFFYNRIREKLQFVLIGCPHSFEDCFCVDMGSNIQEDGYVFTIEKTDGAYRSEIRDPEFAGYFCGQKADVAVSHVTETKTRVQVPEEVPLSVYKSSFWDEYNARCIGCGRCTIACPTCTCFSMQDTFYDPNGKIGERRRVNASCMIDGYTDVAGGGFYRGKHGERMRFKVLHKISDYKKRFGYQMCVGCGRCDRICPEYISFSTLVNNLNTEIRMED